MLKLWITYAWQDNEAKDVDFIAQELTAAGIDVRLDRWDLVAGRRLWEQIDQKISNPEESDAWLIYAAANSLGSEPCREEVAYALDRALSKRGAGYLVVALFAGAENFALFPAALRTRLCVSLEDPDWVARIRRGLEGKALGRPALNVPPYELRVHRGEHDVWLEVRPRAGAWPNFAFGVPVEDAPYPSLKPYVGPFGKIPSGSGMFAYREYGRTAHFNGGQADMAIVQTDKTASPGVSGFVRLDRVPRVICFGAADGDMYVVPMA